MDEDKVDQGFVGLDQQVKPRGSFKVGIARRSSLVVVRIVTKVTQDTVAQLSPRDQPARRFRGGAERPPPTSISSTLGNHLLSGRKIKGCSSQDEKKSCGWRDAVSTIAIMSSQQYERLTPSVTGSKNSTLVVGHVVDPLWLYSPLESGVGCFSNLSFGPQPRSAASPLWVVANPRNTPDGGYLVYQYLALVLPKLVFGPTIAASRYDALPFGLFLLLLRTHLGTCQN
jgi:hypothetical protein